MRTNLSTLFKRMTSLDNKVDYTCGRLLHGFWIKPGEGAKELCSLLDGILLRKWLAEVGSQLPELGIL